MCPLKPRTQHIAQRSRVGEWMPPSKSQDWLSFQLSNSRFKDLCGRLDVAAFGFALNVSWSLSYSLSVRGNVTCTIMTVISCGLNHLCLMPENKKKQMDKWIWALDTKGCENWALLQEIPQHGKVGSPQILSHSSSPSNHQVNRAETSKHGRLFVVVKQKRMSRMSYQSPSISTNTMSPCRRRIWANHHRRSQMWTHSVVLVLRFMPTWLGDKF